LVSNYRFLESINLTFILSAFAELKKVEIPGLEIPGLEIPGLFVQVFLLGFLANGWSFDE